jgi:hypothetical protein
MVRLRDKLSHIVLGKNEMIILPRLVETSQGYGLLLDVLSTHRIEKSPLGRYRASDLKRRMVSDWAGRATAKIGLRPESA